MFLSYDTSIRFSLRSLVTWARTIRRKYVRGAGLLYGLDTGGLVCSLMLALSVGCTKVGVWAGGLCCLRSFFTEAGIFLLGFREAHLVKWSCVSF